MTASIWLRSLMRLSSTSSTTASKRFMSTASTSSSSSSDPVSIPSIEPTTPSTPARLPKKSQTTRPVRFEPNPLSEAGQHAPTGAFAKHTPITPKHNIHVATLHLRSHTASLTSLSFFTSFALRAAKALALPTSGVIALPTRTSLFTVPRSPFAHKKSQENFWRKEHKRAIKVYDGNEEVVAIWLAYLRKEAMGGVGMKAQIFRYKEIGYGQKMVTNDGLRESVLAPESDSDKVKALARELMPELTIVADAQDALNAAQEVHESVDAIEIQTEGVEAAVEGAKTA